MQYLRPVSPVQQRTWACRSAFGFEWFATYYILANKKGYIEKENLRAVYGACTVDAWQLLPLF